MSAWTQLNGELAVSTDRDFERAVLPFLRLFWDNLVQSPKLKHFDNAGIDLVAFGPDSTIQCAVQCKGFFSERDLDPSHYRQIRDSIAKFGATGVHCEEFVLLHNRTGANQALTAKIRADLDELVKTGSAKRVRLWDRQGFVADVRARLMAMVGARLRAQTAELLRRTSGVFQFGDIYVEYVPVTEYRLTLKRHTPPQLDSLGQPAKAHISRLVLSPAKTRWTMLTGMFGAGKSSAALHAAIASAKTVIFSRCADMSAKDGFGGTNKILERVLQSLRLFDEFEDEDRARLERLSGPLLRVLLSRPDGEAILVLDGLDEHRDFSTTMGMTSLANALAELRCPVILTTRQEHFDATFGNFDELFPEFSSKNGAARDARLYKLEAWRDAETIEFLELAAQRAGAGQQQALRALASAIRRHETTPWPSELLHHPLFLQMIAELVADTGAATAGKAQTIYEWTARKIARDLSVPRLMPIDPIDRSAFIDDVMAMMEKTAGAMIDASSDRFQLLEMISSGAVMEIAHSVFGTKRMDIAAIVGVSLLLPVSQRRGASVPMAFSHRIFQEFFTARHIQATGLAAEKFPPSVADLAAELARSGGGTSGAPR